MPRDWLAQPCATNTKRPRAVARRGSIRRSGPQALGSRYTSPPNRAILRTGFSRCVIRGMGCRKSLPSGRSPAAASCAARKRAAESSSGEGVGRPRIASLERKRAVRSAPVAVITLSGFGIAATVDTLPEEPTQVAPNSIAIMDPTVRAEAAMRVGLGLGRPLLSSRPTPKWDDTVERESSMFRGKECVPYNALAKLKKDHITVGSAAANKINSPLSASAFVIQHAQQPVRPSPLSDDLPQNRKPTQGTALDGQTTPRRAKSPAYISIPSHRFCTLIFSFAACWLLS